MGALMMTRGEVDAAFAAALERKQARRNVYQPWTEQERRQAWLEDRPLPKSAGLAAPEFREPETAAEWWDDRILERGSLRGFPETPVLVAVAAAARDGDDGAARAALRAARDLEPAVQWTVFRNLDTWRRDDGAVRLGAERLAVALLAEWSRLRLPETDPAANPPARRRRRPWEITGPEAAAS